MITSSDSNSNSINKNILITFKHISKSFGNQKVLTDLNFDIYRHEIVGILGRSGCGKSTLLKILLGFYNPDSGMILHENMNLVTELKKIRKIVGFVSQENSFYEKLTVKENLIFYSKLYGVSKEDRVHRIDYLLNMVKLTNNQNKLAQNLSGGMKRRLEFAISLVHNPEILILDEPFNGLDIQISDEIWAVIENIKSSGVTVLLVTHILTSAQKHCDRVVFMGDGKIIHQLDNIKLNPINLENKFKEVFIENKIK